MAKTDIKDLGVFGSNRGLDKIKSHYESVSNKLDVLESKLDEKEEQTKEIEIKTNVIEKQTTIKTNPKGAGAPIQKHDRVYATKAPLKLSTLLNATSRNLVEKYETELTRDELLRKALDEYIKQNLSLEDKQELYHAVLKDLELFREKNKTIPEIDKAGNIIRDVDDIEKETATTLKTRWGIK